MPDSASPANLVKTFVHPADAVILQDAASRQFHAMAKPVSSTCNLNCTYCYYLSKATLPGGPATGRMSDEMLELFIKQYIEGISGPEVIFSWQGGEPTLPGVDFFRKVVALEKKHAKPGQKIQNDLQTNGIVRVSQRESFSRRLEH
jgi:uncharacterized protein